jgi:hypothetical protein
MSEGELVIGVIAADVPDGDRPGDTSDGRIGGRDIALAAAAVLAMGASMPRMGGGYQGRSKGPKGHRKFPIPR